MPLPLFISRGFSCLVNFFRSVVTGDVLANKDKGSGFERIMLVISCVNIIIRDKLFFFMIYVRQHNVEKITISNIKVAVVLKSHVQHVDISSNDAKLRLYLPIQKFDCR